MQIVILSNAVCSESKRLATSGKCNRATGAKYKKWTLSIHENRKGYVFGGMAFGGSFQNIL